MSEQPDNSRRQPPPGSREERGAVDQVVVPAVIAFSGGAGVGVGKAAADAIVAKVSKPKAPVPPTE